MTSNSGLMKLRLTDKAVNRLSLLCSLIQTTRVLTFALAYGIIYTERNERKVLHTMKEKFAHKIRACDLKDGEIFADKYGEVYVRTNLPYTRFVHSIALRDSSTHYFYRDVDVYVKEER